MLDSNFRKATLDGVVVIEPLYNKDKHTKELLTYCKPLFVENGIDTEFVLEEELTYSRGYLRGIEFQREDPQSMLVRVTSGSALVVVVDLRTELEDSYGASYSCELSADNMRQLWVPERFALATLSLEQSTSILVKYSEQHTPKSGIIWNDPILNIEWQFERYDIDEKYLNISKEDKRFPIFRSWNVSDLWL